MPYSTEKANRLTHVNIINSESVRNSLSRWHIPSSEVPINSELTSLCISVDNLPGDDYSEKVLYGITVDGSDMEVEATRDHPTVKVEYLRVAASFIDFSKLKKSGEGEFVNPYLLRASHQSSSFDGVLPGSGLVEPGLSGVQTWRKELYLLFSSTRFDGDSSDTLLDMLYEISGSPGNPAKQLILAKCPQCNFSERNISIPPGGTNCYRCGETIYPTDILRTAEEYSIEGSNQSPLTRTMLVAERLTMYGLMKALHEGGIRSNILEKTLFITDGPLALFGVVAPLHRKLHEYIQNMQFELSKKSTTPMPLMIGIEKSGRFVEHADIISPILENGTLLHLTQSYINKITGRSADNKYGVDEFYGRRFIYKTNSGNTIVFTVPPKYGVKPYGDEESEIIENYPTLKTMCKVLDRIQTRLYPNAVIPVALAHNAAALPLGVGQSVLRAFSQESLGLPRSSRGFQKGPFAR